MTETDFTHLTSAEERGRRHDALRAAMTSAGLDALVIAGRGDEFVRGRIQYVSDVFCWAGWCYVVLPARGAAAYVGDPLWGTGRAELAGWLEEFRLTQSPGREVAGILSDLGLRTGAVGIVGLHDAAASAHVQQLRDSAPGVTFSDAADLFDGVRAIKSDEEIGNLRETSMILRKVFAALEAELRPGVPERDVLAEAHRLARQFGCLDGIAILGRPPFRMFGPGRAEPLRSDDSIVIDLEWGGPSGYWLELRRCFSFGAPSEKARRFFEIRREVFEACVDAMRPGAPSTDILAARDAAYARHGMPPVDGLRYSAHGIGVDSLEPPWVPGKDRILEAGMVVSLHPDAVLEDAADRALLGGISVADNVLVTPTGAVPLTDATVEWVIL